MSRSATRNPNTPWRISRNANIWRRSDTFSISRSLRLSAFRPQARRDFRHSARDFSPGRQEDAADVRTARPSRRHHGQLSHRGCPRYTSLAFSPTALHASTLVPQSLRQTQKAT